MPKSEQFPCHALRLCYNKMPKHNGLFITLLEYFENETRINEQ